MKSFETVIGLEVHAQLRTDSKIFATSPSTSGDDPNANTDPVTLGLPGCLPVLNRRAVEFAIKLGLATGSDIAERSVFARKHYFYPDLPKGYQISQYEEPICIGGEVTIRVEGEARKIPLTRIHLEEDAGKSTHSDNEPSSLVDLNRAGVPLVEIVSEPELRSPEEAVAYLKQLRQILRYLDVCDGNMEAGNFRCDANISLRPLGATELGTKVEVKNLNSFRFVERALEHEISRQHMLLEQGDEIVQETRLWDENRGVTRTMRSKEEAEDYRYFPDPDLLPLEVNSRWIEKVRETLPELPGEVFERFQSMYNLEDEQIEMLSEELYTSIYFDQTVSAHNNPTAAANWITTELFGRLNKENLDMMSCPVSPEHLGTLIKLIDEGVISGKIAKTVFDEMFSSGLDPEKIVESKNLKQISDEGFLRDVVKEILEANPAQVAELKQGKNKVLGFFVGQVMKKTAGKANPQSVNELIKELIGD
jgi:aspartyl-tRNA(Asn)/glutamyl-tRNA(Gln) amidotransferase subunit B